jgi:hypothetical protein
LTDVSEVLAALIIKAIFLSFLPDDGTVTTFQNVIL